jgi:hypothetical protein
VEPAQPVDVEIQTTRLMFSAESEWFRWSPVEDFLD